MPCTNLKKTISAPATPAMDPVLFLSDLIAKLGYFGVAFAMFVESIFPPIPSEIVLPFAGFAASQGKLSLIGVLIAATIGSLTGAVALYFCGRLITDSRLQKLVERWGKPIGIKHSDILKAQSWFDQHGHKAVLLGRMIPGVRSVISLPAGINKMPFLPFVLWSGIGTALWSGLLCVAGYLLGSRYHAVSEYIDPISKIILAAILAWCGYLIVRKLKSKTDSNVGD